MSIHERDYMRSKPLTGPRRARRPFAEGLEELASAMGVQAAPSSTPLCIDHAPDCACPVCQVVKVELDRASPALPPTELDEVHRDFSDPDATQFEHEFMSE